MANTPRVGTGATLTWGTSTALDGIEILSVTQSEQGRGSISTSHLGTTGTMTSAPTDLIDPGTLDVEAQLPGDLMDAMYTAMGAAAETVTFTFKKLTAEATTAPKASGSAFLQSINWVNPFEDKVTLGFTVKWAGAVTYADAT